jgi:hypothetical protein
MKTIQILLATLLMTPALSFAGPGISSGDDSRKNYTCIHSGVQDSSTVTIFTDVLGETPTAGLYIATGETSSRLVQGTCSRPENIDEFYLNCAIPDGFDIYKLTLHSRGTVELVSTVKKIESKENETTLPCYLNEM